MTVSGNGMVTLKKYLYDWEPELRRALSIFFDGLANSAVRSDDGDYADLDGEWASGS